MSVYHLSPVNKNAALVTGQSGCENPGNETIEQAIEKKKSQLQWILKARECHPKSSKKYKALGKEYRDVCSEIKELKDRRKNVHGNERGLSDYINDVCRAKFNKYEWSRIVELARQEKRLNEKKKYANQS